MVKKKETKKKEPAKGNRGRKNWWDMLQMEDRLDAIQGWAKQGSTNEEIWTMLGISKDLFYKWQREKPEFAAAIRKGKFDSNGELLNSAFKQAMGYMVTEETQESVLMNERDWYRDEETGKIVRTKMEVTKRVTKHVQPNAATLIFMLKNRLPAEYRDKIEHELTGDVGVMFVDDIPMDPVGDGQDETNKLD